jgi:hypothetical protein
MQHDLPTGRVFLNANPNPLGRSLYLECTERLGTRRRNVRERDQHQPGSRHTTATQLTRLTPAASVTAPMGYGMDHSQCFEPTMTLQINGDVKYQSVARRSPATRQSAGFSGSIASLDPRVTQYVELFGTWSASNAANTTTVQQMKLFGCN